MIELKSPNQNLLVENQREDNKIPSLGKNSKRMLLKKVNVSFLKYPTKKQSILKKKKKIF
jgi:hypothetical protein